jgi:pimeloyl-ACP methyl ester carboxylesterase
VRPVLPLRARRKSEAATAGEAVPEGPPRSGRTVALLLGGLAALTGSALGTTLGSAAYFARRVVTPDENQPDDVMVLAHDDDSVTFATGPDPVVPGRYGIWLDGGAGHARVGEIVAQDDTSVTRRLLSVDRGRLAVGPARWNQYYWWDRPSVSMGLPDEDAVVISDVGALPGWVVRPDPGTDTGAWAVLVHGRGARKEETLRAVPVLRRAGFTSLVAAYRNDRDAPKGPDGRYNLGLSEWRDVEAAMAYAVSRGARDIVLFGWSMGGAIVLQVLDNSRLADRVTGVVLDSAVLDWRAVLHHQARMNRLPGWLSRVATGLMGDVRARRLVGVHEPIDVARADWVNRAAELRHPLLVIHSDGDDFVPVGPAVALANRRPDLVRFERWQQARHCREWNTDSARWERAVGQFLATR